MSLPNLNKALYEALVGNGAVAAIVGTKVYNTQVTANVTPPYLVYYLVSGYSMNWVAHDIFSYTYRVDAWQTTAKLARTLSEAVFDALHQQTLTVSGFNNYWMAVHREQSFIENVSGSQWYRHVLDIEIKCDET